MFIELLGMPGCGKSYLCEQWIQEFSKKNITAENVIHNVRENLFYKILFKLITIRIHFSPQYLRMAKQIKMILSDQLTVKSEYIMDGLESYVWDIIELIALKRRLSRKIRSVMSPQKEKVYLLDEGILQRIVTMKVYYNLNQITVDSLITYLSEYIDHTFYLYTDTEMSYKSIRERNRNVCAFDRLDDERLKKFLNDYKASCDRIKEQLSLKVINRGDKYPF